MTAVTKRKVKSQKYLFLVCYMLSDYTAKDIWKPSEWQLSIQSYAIWIFSINPENILHCGTSGFVFINKNIYLTLTFYVDVILVAIHMLFFH